MCVSRPFGLGSLSGLEGAVEKQQQQQSQAASLKAGPIRFTPRGLKHDHSPNTHPQCTTSPNNQRNKARYDGVMARGLIAMLLEAGEKSSSHVFSLSGIQL